MSKLLKTIANYSKSRISLDEIDIHNYVSTDNLLQNKLGKVDAEKMPTQSSNNVTRFDKGDILIANIRPYLKKIWLAKYTGGSSSDVLTFKVNKNYNSTFVYYSLFRDDFFEHMMNGSKGTKMPRGDKNQILDFPISDFEIGYQKQIAKVLSDLDSKIEINNKINKELEAMAKTLYDYWFVQFDFPDKNGKPYKSSEGKMIFNEDLKCEIPVGWEVDNLSSWIKNDKSGDWGKETEQGNYVNKVSCIRGADLNGINGKGSVKSPTRFVLEKNSHKLLEIGDFIIEISGGSPTQSTGRMAFITKETLERFENPLICSNFCKAVTLKDEKSLYNFAYEWNRIYDAGVLFGWEGKTSGIKNLLFESFVTNHKLSKPNSDIMEQFYAKAKPIHAQIQKNLIQNQKLSELRDWLLPMLMNGQVSVGEK
ncbi:restriction endonuclease subunit S [Tenacibaculum piscium]|uniref:restriction endonuclease subunit S n=1 Tax=Tenacibaculum piscium TaxID=1458515 RepID=UPI001F248183|nr:restriction endonuclease subunit S [Tenacibaculum piscium]